MDEDQQYERFDVDNDFEGGQWIGGEFFASSKRKKRQQTEDDRIYGVFAGSSSDEDDRGGRRAKREKADYSKPVGFVSSGKFVQDPDKGEQQQKQQQQQKQGVGAGAGFLPAKQRHQQQEEEEGDEDAGGGGGRGGLGFGGGGGGLGFTGGGGGGGGLGFTGGSGGGGGLGFKSAGSAAPGLSSGSDGAGGGRPGLGAGGGRPGLGARGGIGARQEEQEEEEEDAAVLPTEFGKRIKAAAERRQHRSAQEAAEKRKAHGARGGIGAGGGAGGGAPDPKFASFEVYTKGIGSKLLSKMGYRPGEGLGKEKQGIAKPLEPKLRPKGMGMGFGDFKEAKMIAPGSIDEKRAAEEAAEEEEDDRAAGSGGERGRGGKRAEQQQQQQGGLWRKKAAPARQKRTYRTADEVLAESQERGLAGGGGGPAAQPILDLRGPTARVITNLEQLASGPDAGGADDVPMPELQHNLTLLVTMTEAQLQRLDAKLQHDQDTAAILASERKLLEQEAEDRAAAVDRLETLHLRLGRLTAAAAAANGAGPDGAAAAPAPGAAAAEWAQLKREYREEYVMYGLAAAALPAALPVLTGALAGWAPLAAPRQGAAEFAAWRPLLETEGARQAVLGGGEDPYSAAVEELVLPPLRSTVTTWEPRNPEPMLTWMDTWERLLPPAALSHVLMSLVLPRLAAAVESWDPRQETVPIHAWLHPWLPHLGPQLESFYPTIRHRLAAALTAWHPGDDSARLLLAPWRRVFDQSDWDALLNRCIAPKLAYALQELSVNPAAQDLEPFNWVLAWDGLLAGPQLAALLEQWFFPKWLAVLHHWLGASPNYDEVTRWYLAWKGLFPQSLLDQPRVRACFNAALNAMNSAADGQPLPPAPAPAAEAGAAAPEPTAGAGAAGSGGGGGGRWGGPEPTLRDLVARYAEESGFEFLPKPGRLHDGLQVYSFGGVSCVLEPAAGAVRALLAGAGERWAPVSLERLAQEAARRQAR